MARGGQVAQRVDAVREACARVAAAAGHVRIDDARLAALAGEIAGAPPAPPHPVAAFGLEPRAAASCALVNAALAFGSGWWPTIRRRPGLSGARTMTAGLMDRFAAEGPWSADALAAIDAGALAGVLGQDPGHELMALYAAVLRDLGARLASGHGGDPLGPVRAAGGDAAALVDLLAGWECFADVSRYRGMEVPFLKRAQLAAADLHRSGAAGLTGLGRLTALADNLVPHTLAVEGVLVLDPALAARIAAGELLVHGSEEEVELRACGVTAVERIAALADRAPVDVDGILWLRGRRPEVKAHPRPRARCTAY